VALRLISLALLLGKIDNAQGRIGPSVALRLTMIAAIDREFRLDQRDGQHFAASLVGCAACRRTQRA
jgi:hypothetical protein